MVESACPCVCDAVLCIWIVETTLLLLWGFGCRHLGTFDGMLLAFLSLCMGNGVSAIANAQANVQLGRTIE